MAGAIATAEAMPQRIVRNAYASCIFQFLEYAVLYELPNVQKVDKIKKLELILNKQGRILHGAEESVLDTWLEYLEKEACKELKSKEIYEACLIAAEEKGYYKAIERLKSYFNETVNSHLLTAK